MNAVIRHTTSYIPEKVLTNRDLEQVVDTSDEWIVTRTGIRERRIAQKDECTSTMGAYAAKKLIEETNLDPKSIDLIILSSMTPDYLCPASSAIIQNEIGAIHAGAFDLEAACTGYIYGLSVSKAFIESGQYETILLIASEKNSAFIDYTDRNTCILFGDGAGASLIQKGGQGLHILSSDLGSSGSESSLITIPAGGSRSPFGNKQDHFLQMNGREVFKHAVRRMEESMHTCIQKCNLSAQDIRWLVPHQANLRIIETLAKRFGIPMEQVVVTIDRYANTSSATIPIALDHLLQKDSVITNDYILLTAIGAGLVWGSTLLQKI